MGDKVHDELNRLRLVIKDLIAVTENLLNRIENLEIANKGKVSPPLYKMRISHRTDGSLNVYYEAIEE